MKTTKKTTRRYYPAFLFALIGLIVTISGCSLNGVGNQAEDITEEDLQAASNILGESLSDETSGVMGSLNDAVTTISKEGFIRSGPAKSSMSYTMDDDDNSGRGRESNFSYDYDPSTGTHTISFMRSVNKPNFSKSVTDTLKYIFTDNNGEFVQFPRLNRERIETIDFKGFREGMLESPKRNSFFVRTDSFLIDGVSQASEILNIDGVHNGRGNAEVNSESGNIIEREYTLEINFLNIEIDKAVVRQNQSLEQGVTGTLTWEMIIQKTTDGSATEKTIRGTIEMNGDGTALLRFDKFQKLFHINLDDGDVRDQNDEFEGRVTSVDLDRNTFTLSNGRVVRITDNTTIESDGDLFSLDQVFRTLEHTPNVRAEGEGTIDGDVFVADEVKFEVDDDSDDNDREKDFEGNIASVSLEGGTFTLESDLVIQIVDKTQIDNEGDYTTLQAVADALEQGTPIEADGEGFVPRDNSNTSADLIAIEVEFDNDENDDGQGDDSKNTEQFESKVVSVNSDAHTFILETGLVIEITEETTIDGEGDYQSLDAVDQALSQGFTVEAEGTGVKPDSNSESSADLLAKVVNFESDEDD